MLKHLPLYSDSCLYNQQDNLEYKRKSLHLIIMRQATELQGFLPQERVF